MQDYFLGNCIFYILNFKSEQISYFMKSPGYIKEGLLPPRFQTYWLAVTIKMSWDSAKVLNLIVLFALLVGC